MRSIHIELNGREDKLSFYENDNIEKPHASRDKILIDVKAATLPCLDPKILRDLFKHESLQHCSSSFEIAGVVSEIGDQTSAFKIGDRVAGVLPMNSDCSGLAEFCTIAEYDVVKIPEELSFEIAAGGIGDSVKGYTALYYCGHLVRGESVLITDPLSTWATLVIQLAKTWGAKIYILMFNEDTEKNTLQQLVDTNNIIDCSNGKPITESLMQETGGLGVDIIIDNGVRQFYNEEDEKSFSEEKRMNLPHKQDMINCLAIGGRWVTSVYDLQLDPPNSRQIFMRNGSINFLFEKTWTLSGSGKGKYQHILKDVMRKLANQELKPNITKLLPFSEALSYLQEFHELQNSKEKTVVIF